MAGILEGLRLVEGTAFVAAPLGGMTLAALGADVIRFDDIHGGLDFKRWPITKEDVSLYWAGLNKGKRSFAVDLRSPRGRELIAELITAPGPDAGLFTTNLPVREWMSYETLSARRKDLIMLSLTGARDGSAQVDYTVNAVTGFPLITGPVGHEGPVNQVLPAWDLATGYAISTALLAAERHRSRHGTGQFIRLTLQDIALSSTAALGYLGEAEINRTSRPRYGNEVFGTFARDFRTRDGRYVMICIFTRRQLDALADAGGFADTFAEIENRHGVSLKNEADRWNMRSKIAAVLEPWIASLTAEEAAQKLTEANALWAPYQMPAELVDNHPLLTENPMFERISQPGIGELWSAGSPLVFSGSDRLPPQPAPQLGQHTDEILADVLGLSSHQIGTLHDDGVVAGPPEPS